MKGALHRAEIEKQVLATKGFDTNIANFLLLYHVIISNMHVCFFTGMLSRVCGRAPQTVLSAQNLAHEKL